MSKKLNIAFLDDEKDICMMSEIAFSNEDVKVHTFTEAQDFLDYVESNSVDICFFDYRLPKITGVEVKKQLKKEVPSYLISGDLMMESEEGLFLDIFDKPVDIPVIRELIKSYL